jgi:hypothetical protein
MECEFPGRGGSCGGSLRLPELEIEGSIHVFEFSSAFTDLRACHGNDYIMRVT